MKVRRVGCASRVMVCVMLRCLRPGLPEWDGGGSLSLGGLFIGEEAWV